MPLALLSVDPALGRLDYHSLSDQALMEMIIDQREDTYVEQYLDDNGNYIDVCEWKEVTCTDERVTKVRLIYSKFTDKQFPFDFLPPCVSFFEADLRNLHGTLDTALLRTTLVEISVSDNALHGSFILKTVPRDIERMYIAGNNFSGSLTLSDIPEKVIAFEANNNEFVGEISLNDLPPQMEELELSVNKLCGSLSIGALPTSMREIRLNSNEFSGDFTMLSIPESLFEFAIQKNALSGKAILKRKTGKMHFYLLHDCITSVVDENGEKHEWHDEIMRQNEGQ